MKRPKDGPGSLRWKLIRRKTWLEFEQSTNWWSLSVCPLSWRQMVFAVGNGDGEIKVTTATGAKTYEDIPDIFFRWKRPMKKRWDKYTEIYLPDHHMGAILREILLHIKNPSKQVRELVAMGLEDIRRESEDYPKATKNHPDWVWNQRRCRAAKKFVLKRKVCRGHCG
jgi:hypothetical protein